jgi:hypothetical protein
MRKLNLLFLLVIVATSIFAQSPQKMSYQAVIRNSSDQLVTNHAVGMRLSILKGSATGTAVYVETQTPTSNANGLVTIEIGGGTPVTGTFAGIDWSTGVYFIRTETDPTGNTSYTISGTSQLLSVPYALFAKRAGEHYVGELYGGGVVFYVDQTGQHGLICSMIDLSASQAWSNVTSTLIGINAQSDWDGLINSTAIVGQSGHTISAAKLCLDYTNADYGTGVYSDWYLPSRSELNNLWNNIYQVQKALDNDGNLATTALVKNNYWSSTESDATYAWYCSFTLGITNNDGWGKVLTRYVRAIRSF